MSGTTRGANESAARASSGESGLGDRIHLGGSPILDPVDDGNDHQVGERASWPDGSCWRPGSRDLDHATRLRDLGRASDELAAGRERISSDRRCVSG